MGASKNVFFVESCSSRLCGEEVVVEVDGNVGWVGKVYSSRVVCVLCNVGTCFYGVGTAIVGAETGCAKIISI